MKFYLGIDIGAISIKAALFATEENANALNAKMNGAKEFFKAEAENSDGKSIWFSNYRRIYGGLLENSNKLIEEIYALVGKENIASIHVTGSGGRVLEKKYNLLRDNEFSSIVKGMELLYPEVRTVFEIGGEGSKYIRFTRLNDKLHIADYEVSGDCAAGTGSFIDQQAARMKYKVEEISKLISETKKTPVIAGRCSVFAKSDMIHAQQKGFQPAEILKGLCEAVARNFKSCITKGKDIETKVAFIGAVSQNLGVTEFIKQSFELSDDDFFVPQYYSWIGALGSAMLAEKASNKEHDKSDSLISLDHNGKAEKFGYQDKLVLDDVVFLKDKVKQYELSTDSKARKIDAYLGIDIGSVSTNFALIDNKGEVIKEIYVRTQGRPVEVVSKGLTDLHKELGDKISIKGVGTTGSGRELIAELIGADTVNDEITAHKTGSSTISRMMDTGNVDTIFEIGGQDSKFISIDDGIVTDFTMNEACAAGTGSFLEEQAGKLGVNIIDEFSQMALSSDNPIRMGERCTVFMERDVNSYLQRGGQLKDILAGLAYSVVLNYLNRVVGNRKIGDVIYFQGGTAYNNAVASAFSMVLGKKVIVPPYNGVLGALGEALLVKEHMQMTGLKTKFRGFHMDKVKYTIREFTCKACTNNCDIQEFDIGGEKTYWGDKCSVKFRKKAKAAKKPVIDDLVAIREKLLIERHDEKISKRGKTVGVPRAMYFFDRFPFWNEYLQKLGFTVVLSDITSKKVAKKGIELTVAEPCFPIKAAHGHVQDLIEKKVDYIFLPNVLNAETKDMKVHSHMCPWGQTMPYIIKAVPQFESYSDKFIIPTVQFRMGKDFVKKGLFEAFKKFGVNKSDSNEACDQAFTAQRTFELKLQRIGREALNKIIDSGQEGIVLVGRGYNVNDPGINVNIPEKLRNFYGVNVIPMDFLPLEGINLDDINPNMFWNYGKKIIAAVKLAREYPNLHIIYMTNFKCGPDSFIKHFATFASDKPFLTLQFDEHQNDAGYMTRCEAYLDSKGVLRCYKEQPKKETQVA